MTKAKRRGTWNQRTTELNRELAGDAGLESYLKRNEPFFNQKSTADLLSRLYRRRPVSKAALARSLGMSEVYIHQVFAGRRNPTRDRLLCLGIGLGAALGELQELLRQAGYAPLYPKIRRDAVITSGVLHQMPVAAINRRLFEVGERTLD